MSPQYRPKIHFFKCLKHCAKINFTSIPLFMSCLIALLMKVCEDKGNVTQLKQHVYAHPHKIQSKDSAELHITYM